MLPFCDEVVVGDAMSTDGTREKLEQLASETGKVRIVDYPRRENIFDEKDFVCKWVNFTREKLKGDYQFYLDADEVAGPETGQTVARGRDQVRALWCRRLNFIVDTKSLIPKGLVCADRVIRSGPKEMFMPMDCAGLHHRESEYHDIQAESNVLIFHYGFLREVKAYYRKCKFMHPALVGAHDSRLDVAEQTGKHWTELIKFDVPLGEYLGKHPDIAIPWLKQRGYNP